MPDDGENLSAESTLTAIFRFIRTVVIADVILFTITGLICYLIGWHTLRGLSDGLLFAGLSIAALVYLTSGTHLPTGHTDRRVKLLAYKTLLETGAPPPLSYTMVFAGFVAILASILIGLFA